MITTGDEQACWERVAPEVRRQRTDAFRVRGYAWQPWTGGCVRRTHDVREFAPDQHTLAVHGYLEAVFKSVFVFCFIEVC